MKLQAKTVGSGAIVVAAAAAASSNTALAGDFPGRSAPPMAAPTWQGFYVGASLGASWLASDFSSTATYGSTRANAPGWLGGLQAGYNWQDRNFVWGIEGDISFLGSSNSSANTNTSYTASSKVNGVSTLRARFGFDFDGTMPYLTAGLALGSIKNNLAYGNRGYSGSSTKTSLTPGVALGGGIEHQFADSHWSLRGEVLWIGFQDKSLPSFTASGAGVSYTVPGGRFSNDLVMGRIGLNYRF
ncbi:MAG TPA: outer membrane beta-barrel protein [Xanthobacteraceae bacterium]